MKDIEPQELQHLLATANSNLQLLDVREQQEFDSGHFLGSHWIPIAEVTRRYTDLNPKQTIVVICLHGVRSRIAAYYLEQAGFCDILNLRGGIEAWCNVFQPPHDPYFVKPSSAQQ